MKSKIIGRKQLLIATVSLALCAAVFINWYYTKPEGLTDEAPEVSENANLGEAQYVNGTKNIDESDYFGAARLNRSKAHDLAKEELEKIISDEKTDEETKSKARERLISLSAGIKTEADIENLITAQLNKSCLATLDSDSIEIVLPKGTINSEILIKVKDIVLSKTSLSSENITIIELK